MKILHENLRIFRKKGNVRRSGLSLLLYLRNGQNHGMIFLAQILPAGVLWCKKPERAWRPAAIALDGCRFLPARLCRAIARSAMQTAGALGEAVPLRPPPPNRRRMVETRNPAPPLAGYAAQSRKARCKTAGAPSEAVPLSSAAEQAANGWSPQPCPPLAGYAAQSRKRDAKTAGAPSEAVPLSSAAEQAANGWSPQPCPTTSRLCRAIAQSAMQKTAGAPSEAVPLSSRRRTGGEWMEPATLPHH